MAQKRMFDKAIIDTDRFMDLPMSAKALYFLLGMEADDEGFVSYKKVLRIHGGNEDDAKLLEAKKFTIHFPSGVMVITEWNKNNWLDNRRIKPTEYQAEKKSLLLDKDRIYCLAGAKPSLRESRVEQSRVEYIGSETAEEKPVKEKKVFVFEEKLELMKQNPRGEIKIIALYWIYKGYKPENEEQYNSAFKRELKPAKELIGYNSKQLTETMDFCQSKFEMWTLETVGKRINDVIKQ